MSIDTLAPNPNENEKHNPIPGPETIPNQPETPAEPTQVPSLEAPAAQTPEPVIPPVSTPESKQGISKKVIGAGVGVGLAVAGGLAATQIGGGESANHDQTPIEGEAPAPADVTESPDAPVEIEAPAAETAATPRSLTELMPGIASDAEILQLLGAESGESLQNAEAKDLNPAENGGILSTYSANTAESSITIQVIDNQAAEQAATASEGPQLEGAAPYGSREHSAELFNLELFDYDNGDVRLGAAGREGNVRIDDKTGRFSVYLSATSETAALPPIVQNGAVNAHWQPIVGNLVSQAFELDAQAAPAEPEAPAAETEAPTETNAIPPEIPADLAPGVQMPDDQGYIWEGQPDGQPPVNIGQGA